MGVFSLPVSDIVVTRSLGEKTDGSFCADKKLDFVLVG